MYLCNDNHDEICFVDHNCPLCSIRTELKEDIHEKKNEIDALNTTIDNFKDEVADLNANVERLSNDVDRLNKDLQLTRDGRTDGER